MNDIKELPNINIQCLAADEKALWVGTLGGLLQFTFDKYLWKKINKNDGVLDDEIRKVFSAGDLTAAITRKGISLISHPTNSLHSWNFEDLGLREVSPSIEIFILDDVASIAQKGSFLLYSNYSDKSRGHDWKKYLLPPEFKGVQVCTFLRDKDVLWVGGDGFLGAFHMGEEKWLAVAPISGKALSLLLEGDKIWLCLPNGVCWMTRKDFEIDKNMDHQPIPNTKDLTLGDGRIYVLTSKTILCLQPAEVSRTDITMKPNKSTETTEDKSKVNNKAGKNGKERKRVTITDLGKLGGFSEKGRRKPELVSFYADKDNIHVVTADATIKRFVIKENRWYTHQSPLTRRSKQIGITKNGETDAIAANPDNIWLKNNDDRLFRFDRKKFKWTLVALPFYLYPLEVSILGRGGLYIGDSLVVGDILWYIERESEDSYFGQLKKLNLRNGDVNEVKNLPPIRKLCLDGEDVLAVARYHLLSFKNAGDNYTCHTLIYKFEWLRKRKNDFTATETENQVLQPSMDRFSGSPVLIGSLECDAENIWMYGASLRNPMDTSADYTLVGGGLFKYDKNNHKWEWVLKPEDIDKETVTQMEYHGREFHHNYVRKHGITSMEKSGDKLFLGTESKIYIYNTSDGSVKQFITKEDGVLTDDVRLIHNLDDAIWIVTYKYIIYNKQDGSFIKYDEPFEDKFVLQKFNRATKAWEKEEGFINFEPPYHALKTIMDIKECTLFGTLAGIFKYDKKNKVWIKCDILDGLSNQRVNSISRWSNHIIVATDNGLYIVPYGAV